MKNLQAKFAPVLFFFFLIFSSCQDPLIVEELTLNTDNFTEYRSDALSRVPDYTEIKAVPTASGPVAYTCDTYFMPNGEIKFICIPAGWDGDDLVVYAHGYISEFEPIQLPVDEITTALPLAANFGMAFATTSFSANGMAIQLGIDEIMELKQFFIDEYAQPNRAFLAGGSQGGIITTLTMERYPGEFDGGLSLCGPCGDFQKQLNHYGDFRLLFDYYFPGVLPQDPDNPFTKIPPELIEYWEIGPSGTPLDSYSAAIINALSLDQASTQKLMSVSKAPFDPYDINSIGETVLSTLWYHIFTIENSIDVIGGLAYFNIGKRYYGTGDPQEDLVLNLSIPRINRDNKALKVVRNFYETSGNIEDPLVMMHTTLDPIQLYEQQQLYTLKILRKRNDDKFNAFNIPIYGHCNFTPEELLNAFNNLLSMVAEQELMAMNR